MNNDFYKSLIKESPIGYAYHKILCNEDGIPCDYEFIEVNSAFEILNKPDKLTPEEFELIKRHPEAGYQILRSVEEYSSLAEYVLCHHERWDGNGYPQKLKGEMIPLTARIIAVADAFEAMTAGRSYKTATDKDEAVLELKRNSGTQFDPKIVEVFVEEVLHSIA